MSDSTQELVSRSRENVDAVVSAQLTAARGFSQITKHWVEYASKTYEEALDAAQRVAGAKSLAEATEIQTRFANDALEAFMDESKSLTNLSAGVMKDLSAPFSRTGSGKVPAKKAS